MTSKNERVDCSSLVLLFCRACEILVKREKKLASQPGNQISSVRLLFFLNNGKVTVSGGV